MEVPGGEAVEIIILNSFSRNASLRSRYLNKGMEEMRQWTMWIAAERVFYQGTVVGNIYTVFKGKQGKQCPGTLRECEGDIRRCGQKGNALIFFLFFF